MAKSARWLSIGSRVRRKKASRWRGSKVRSNLSAQGMFVPLILDATIQGIGWIASTLFRTEKLYDLFGAGTFLALAAQGCLSSSTGDPRKNVLLTGMTCTWALRLGTFLVTRVFRRGGDRRFDPAKENPPLFFVFWFIQGVWVFVTLLPLFLVQNRGLESAWSSSDTIGLVIWSSGFLVESVADYQKFVFRSVPTNKEKFIRSGLWKYSRHPNYFGEIMLWWGFWLCSISSIPGIQLKTLAASSPVLVTLLLTKVSGIPLLEEAADAKWGQEKDYQEYKQKTPILLPLPRL